MQKTLFERLKELYPESSHTTLRSWLQQGRVSVGSQCVRDGRHLITEGESIQLAGRYAQAEEGVKILFEDQDLVVIDKPAGLLSVATDSGHEKNAHEILKRRFHRRRVYPVHRLDREVSGVMLFVYTERAKEQFKKLFAAHDITRQYIAIVEGKVQEQVGTWKSYLREDANFKVHASNHPGRGEVSITHYQLLTAGKHVSALLLTLETGRKNQIRVHSATAHHPIVGDEKYGAKTKVEGRILLHAHLLGFIHPITKKPMEFVSPIPESFFKILPELQGVQEVSSRPHFAQPQQRSSYRKRH